MSHTITLAEKQKTVFSLCRVSFDGEEYLVQYPEGNDTHHKTLGRAIGSAYRNLLADGII